MSNLGIALAVLGSLAWLYVVARTYRSGRGPDTVSPERNLWLDRKRRRAFSAARSHRCPNRRRVTRAS